MTHGSLFSGIGGFDLAAEWMGWENVFHCEWNPFGQKVLKHYWPNAISYEDITKTDFTVHRGKIDIITGGFPCQPYSSAGKRKGKDDERHLWPSMLRAIREIQPRWIVGENVLGLVNWSGGLVFEEVQADLEAEGYEVQPFVLPAASVGAPHLRQRVWFVAYNNRIIWGTRRDAKSTKQSRYRESILPITTERTTPNSNSNGLNECNSEYEINTSEETINALSNSKQIHIQQSITEHSDSIRQERRMYKVKSKVTIRKHFSKRNARSIKPTNWQNFPTVSPICSRNDGLSNRLHSITFSKWRSESIKAGGNAIVPQVVFQIFKTIHQYETKQNDSRGNVQTL